MHELEQEDLLAGPSDSGSCCRLGAAALLVIQRKADDRLELARASSGSTTLMVRIPMARAGLRLTPRSSRKTASDGSIRSCSQANW